MPSNTRDPRPPDSLVRATGSTSQRGNHKDGGTVFESRLGQSSSPCLRSVTRIGLVPPRHVRRDAADHLVLVEGLREPGPLALPVQRIAERAASLSRA